MSAFKTRDGSDYTPLYLTDINGETCIGCGRCFKVCPQNVMALYGVDDTGKFWESSPMTTRTTSMANSTARS